MTSIASIITMLLIGLITGISTGLTGAGGGMMILFALIFILKFPLHKANGTSALIMAITRSLARVAGGFFATLGIIVTFILVNENTPFF